LSPVRAPVRARAHPVLSLIGNTPLIPLRFEPEGITLYAKAEFMNPSGSIKDRLALTILGDARRRGWLRPGTTIHTGREILAQMQSRVDAFVSGYGTGGTLNGVSRALRKACPRVQIVAMEPAEAAMLSGESPCCHSIEGVAGGYLPPLLKAVSVDAQEKVPSAEALRMTQRLARDVGLLVGTSSGANVIAALRTAQRLRRGARVVTILCDRAERYYSTRLFAGVGGDA